MAAGARADGPPVRCTEVSIRGEAFHINGRPTYPGRTWNGKRIEGLLEQDVANQGSRPEVVAKLAEFRKDPQAWITANLAPRSYESKAAPDWSKWVPRQE